jgi:hypothetical protein
MAQVASRTRDRVDAILDSLLEAWRGVPQAARSIDQWDLIKQIEYVEEWGARLSVADSLGKRYLTPAQRARYDELQRLTQEYGPVLDRMRLG